MKDSQEAQIHIRDAYPTELDETAEVISAAYMEYASQMPPEMWDQYHDNMRDVRSRLGESELIVAEHEGRIVGAVTFYPDGTHYGPPHWPVSWAGLRLLAVHPDSRGLGIGKGLTEECIRRCKERGIATIGLHNMDVMVTGREMYERMGFERVPQFDGGAKAYKLDFLSPHCC